MSSDRILRKRKSTGDPTTLTLDDVHTKSTVSDTRKRQKQKPSESVLLNKENARPTLRQGGMNDKETIKKDKLLRTSPSSSPSQARRSRRLSGETPLKETASTPSKSSRSGLSIRDENINSTPKHRHHLEQVSTPKTPQELLYEAKSKFRRCATPKKLVGRVQERRFIEEFWSDHVLKEKPGSLYISGCPGTGKTALLDEIIRNMAPEHRKLRYQVKICKINCMTVGDPKLIFPTIVQELFRDMVSAREAPDYLDALFISNKKFSKRPIYVVILDEIDFLITRDQQVLYKLFEWPTLPGCRLVLVGIANALDLTGEPKYLNFKPYDVSDIKEIIMERLNCVDEQHDDDPVKPVLMHPTAVEYCARKLVGTGDLRKALDVCRQAIEVAEGELRANSTSSSVTPNVTIQHIIKASGSALGSMTGGSKKIMELNLHPQVALVALWVMEKKKQTMNLGKWQESYFALCRDKSNGLAAPVTRGEFFDVTSMLETLGIVTIGKAKEERNKKVSLSVHPDDVKLGVQSVPMLKSVLEKLE